MDTRQIILIPSPAQYRAARKERGSQLDVAARLGVSNVTISRREAGIHPITRETWLALLALPLKPKGQPRK